MLAAFATLVFLAAMWLALGSAVLTLLGQENKIIAALRGCSSLAARPQIAGVAVRLSQPARIQRPLRAQPEWRAAA